MTIGDAYIITGATLGALVALCGLSELRQWLRSRADRLARINRRLVWGDQ